MKNKFSYFINLTFIAYFIILFTERVISLVRSFANFSFKTIFSYYFSGFVYTIVILSLVAFMVYLLFKCLDSLKAICKTDTAVDFKNLSIASAILLVSGMFHTEYTISVVQFISYGILIVGLLLKFVELHKQEENKVDLWLAFIYLVVFSMAIPVSYPSLMKSADGFHTLEFITSLSLVAAFGYFAYSLFNEKYKAIYNPIVFIATIILDTTLIAWRWKEEVNVFVLIFLCASILVYSLAFILRKSKK